MVSELRRGLRYEAPSFLKSRLSRHEKIGRLAIRKASSSCKLIACHIDLDIFSSLYLNPATSYRGSAIIWKLGDMSTYFRLVGGFRRTLVRLKQFEPYMPHRCIYVHMYICMYIPVVLDSQSARLDFLPTFHIFHAVHSNDCEHAKPILKFCGIHGFPKTSA